jgi:hypothetical protein
MWKSWLDSGLNLKRAVAAFRAVDILPEGELFLVASFFRGLDLDIVEKLFDDSTRFRLKDYIGRRTMFWDARR